MKTTTIFKDYCIEKVSGTGLSVIDIYQQIEATYKCLLEVRSEKNKSTYSYIAYDPYLSFVGEEKESTITNYVAGKTETIPDQLPLEVLQRLVPKIEVEETYPFFGGVIGFVGYDSIRVYENIGTRQSNALQLPDMHLYAFQDFIIVDHLTNDLFVVSMNLSGTRTEANCQQKVHRTIEQLQGMKKIQRKHATFAITTEPNKEAYMDKVRVSKKYIEQGDIFQVVPSHRIEGTLEGDAFDYYCLLREANPSPYMFYMTFDSYTLLGASPESLFKLRDGYMITNPIAGTRKRGENQEEDDKLAAELLQDEKELAEHRMLVDLSRNDVGRISEPGSITIPKFMAIDRFQYVMHIVSEVQGKLKQEMSAIDALVACLPAGTVSGAPKIRAMQIINELEQEKRGIYAGAIGYMSATGDADFALGIRSMLVKDKKAYIQAGGGIVYDSDPATEFEESMNKAKSLLKVGKA